MGPTGWKQTFFYLFLFLSSSVPTLMLLLLPSRTAYIVRCIERITRRHNSEWMNKKLENNMNENFPIDIKSAWQIDFNMGRRVCVRERESAESDVPFLPCFVYRMSCISWDRLWWYHLIVRKKNFLEHVFELYGSGSNFISARKLF